MEKEIWRDVKGYEGLYCVSNKGNVKSLNYNHTGKEKILKPTTDKYGYLYVNLWKNKKAKTFKLHRLVAEAFIPNPNNYPQCNHLDENKKNNCVENLEWCTAQYNCNYATRNERIVSKTTNGKKSKPVLQIDIETDKIIKEWQSTREVDRQLGFHHSNISACCLGKHKSCGGFRWCFK